jgi:hypothetical protein
LHDSAAPAIRHGVKRCFLLLFLLPAGCSTAPIAGTLDLIRPSRARLTEPRPEREPDARPLPRDDFLDVPKLDR